MCKGIILNGESLYLLCGCFIIAWFIGELYSKEQIDYQTGGPKDINYLYDPMSFLSVFKNDHLYHFYVGEQERHEGKLHNGKCHVVQFAIQVQK